MKKSLSLLPILLIISSFAWSQNVPRFSKYEIAETGLAVYLPDDPGEFEMTESEDGSHVYTAEVTHGDHNFAVIAVDFAEPLGDDAELNTDMIISYLDFLQNQFGITGSAGYGKGHTLESAPDAVGVLDFWEDEEGNQWAVKAWCTSDFMGVLMLYGPEEYPIYNAQEMFLNGFRFPEE